MKHKSRGKSSKKSKEDERLRKKMKVSAKDNKFVRGKKILNLARKQLLEDEMEQSAACVSKILKNKESFDPASDDENEEEDVEIDYDSPEELDELNEEDATALATFFPHDPADGLSREEELLAHNLSRSAGIQSDEQKMPPPAAPQSRVKGKIVASGTASGGAGGTWISLGELLKERVTEARSEIESQLSDVSRASSVISPELQQMFGGLRQVLANYTHGQVPKLLKQLPHMRNCQDVVEELQPERWTSGAISVMTKFFVAKGGDVAGYFLTEVLLPRVRDHIAEHGKLNPTLIDAMHRALFVTKIFFTSFLIPLIQDRHNPCTLAEATVVGGILKKARINPKYACAALFLIVNEPYTPGQIVFVRVLLDKNYKLMDPVMNRVHAFFLRFTDLSEEEKDQYFTDENRMPVLWFQTLLIYVQKYKDYWSKFPDKAKELAFICRVHKHPKITPAIRHELITAPHTDDAAVMDTSGD